MSGAAQNEPDPEAAVDDEYLDGYVDFS